MEATAKKRKRVDFLEHHSVESDLRMWSAHCLGSVSMGILMDDIRKRWGEEALKGAPLPTALFREEAQVKFLMDQSWVWPETARKQAVLANAKEHVHRLLDAAGVPQVTEGEASKLGCVVGQSSLLHSARYLAQVHPEKTKEWLTQGKALFSFFILYAWRQKPSRKTRAMILFALEQGVEPDLLRNILPSTRPQGSYSGPGLSEELRLDFEQVVSKGLASRLERTMEETSLHKPSLRF